MKTLAKYHACNQCVIGEETFENILSGAFEKRAPGPVLEEDMVRSQLRNASNSS